jgi:CRISPR-associated endonuclease/helicase Cas3
LSNWRGEGALSERLAKKVPALDPAWRRELVPQASQLFPTSFKWHDDKSRMPFQLAMLGRMAFSCVVDADYHDTERFYAEASGNSVDRDWATLATIIDGLIARFDAHMADVAGRALGSPLGRLRADILGHARSKAVLSRGVFTLDVPTGGGKTLASLGFALDHARAHRMDRSPRSLIRPPRPSATCLARRTSLSDSSFLWAAS